MKYAVLVGDGMGDLPVAELGGRTLLQASDIPHLRRIAGAGRVHSVRTFPDDRPAGSDVGNLGLLGYNASQTYTGRAPIEAAGAGIPLGEHDVAFRCNLVTLAGGLMQDYSAGHIETGEAHELIRAVDAKLGRPGRRFHGGVSYRHLLIWDRGPADALTTPPHDICGQPVADHLPSGAGAADLRELMESSRAILADHPVNRARVAAGNSPATQIWLWGQGRALRLTPYPEKFGLTGGVVTAVDLVRGLGVLAGLETPVVPGATGFLDTNYEGKVSAAVDLLSRHDFAYLHVEAPDECGHLGDVAKKRQAIEDFDRRVVGPMWRWLEGRGEPYRLVIAMDHRTPITTRVHTREPVPLAVLDGPVGHVAREAPFDESVCDRMPPVDSWTLMPQLLARPSA